MTGTKYSSLPTRAAANKRAAELERWRREQSETREVLWAELRASFKDYQKAIQSGLLEPGSWVQRQWAKNLLGKHARLEGKRVRVTRERADIRLLKGRDNL